MAACLFSNAHLAILEKPAGVHMTDKFAVSTAGRAVWTLDRSVGGLLLYAKTEHVAALAAGARLTYHALVTGEPRHLPGCTVLSCSSAVMARRISLVQLSTAASVSLPSVLRALSSNGHAVVGTSAMKAPGGCHIALTGVHLPAALGSLAFQLPVPRKLAKTQRREELHVLRREATTPSDSIIDFCGLSLLVRAGQLQPRRSSACLVDAAVERLATRPGARLLDLGCGVGSLLLATLSRLESPLGVAVGLDNDEEALSNAATNAAANALAGVHWVNGDFTALHVHAALRKLGPFDVILCNPPYLASASVAGRASVENERVLIGGDDGLAAYAGIAHSLAMCSPALLAPGGVLLLQLSARARAQAEVTAQFRGLQAGETKLDCRGIPRCLVLEHS